MNEPFSWRAAGLVAAGGAVGCLARYAIGVWLTRPEFPWGTVAVNLTGSFAIAFLLLGPLAAGETAPAARALVATGLLGGFTTMSSFAFEATAHAVAGDVPRSVAVVALNVAGSLAAAALGRAAAAALG